MGTQKPKLQFLENGVQVGGGPTTGLSLTSIGDFIIELHKSYV